MTDDQQDPQAASPETPQTGPPAPAARPLAGAPGGRDRYNGGWFRLFHPYAVGFFLTLGGLTAFALGVAVVTLTTVIMYLVFAIFAALGLDPLVRFLMRRGVRRGWAIVIVFAALLLIVAGVLWLVLPTVVTQIVQAVNGLPQLVTDFQKTEFYAWLTTNFGTSVSDILSQVRTFLTDPANLLNISGGILKFGLDVGTGISGMVIVLVLTLYFLASLEPIKTAFVRIAPAHSRPQVAEITSQVTSSIGGYLSGMVVLAFANSVVALLLFLVVGAPFALLGAVLAFGITLIPLVGSVLFWLGASVALLLTDPVAALVFAIAYLIYMQLEAYVLTPRVMNKTISIPGGFVVIGALVGGTLLGLLGALIAIPVTASLILIYKQVVQPRLDAAV